MEESLRQGLVWMREQRIEICVMKKCCDECLFFPGKIYTDEQQQRLLTELLEGQHFWECHYMVIAERKGIKIPRYSCCYGYFYLYHDRIEVLRQAIEDNRIKFIGYEELAGGLRENGFSVNPLMPWEYTPAPWPMKIEEKQ